MRLLNTFMEEGLQFFSRSFFESNSEGLETGWKFFSEKFLANPALALTSSAFMLSLVLPFIAGADEPQVLPSIQCSGGDGGHASSGAFAVHAATQSSHGGDGGSASCDNYIRHEAEHEADSFAAVYAFAVIALGACVLYQCSNVKSKNRDSRSAVAGQAVEDHSDWHFKSLIDGGYSIYSKGFKGGKEERMVVNNNGQFLSVHESNIRLANHG